MIVETKKRTPAAWLAAAVSLAGLGCSGYQTYREAQVAEQVGRWDEAVVHYVKLVEDDPSDISYRAGLLRAKIRAAQEHFRRGREYHRAGVLERALIEYQQAVQLDPTNEYAVVELLKVREELVAARAQSGPTLTLEELKRKTRGAAAQPPVLNPRSTEPISLSFPEEVSAFKIYQALGKAFGINILFDPALRDQPMSIELEEVTAQNALETLMRAAGHFYKVIDERSIIVASDTPQNRRKYEDLVIQTFFLSNAEVKDVMTMLRSLIGARNIAQNEQLNAIVLRDTADKVKVAERIILTNDKSRGEVVVDVELLQIDTSRTQELGVGLSDYFITQELEPNPIPASDLEFINQANWQVTIPSIIYNFVKSSSDAQVLAKPQLRISDGEEAKLTIGDRVPIPVTTFNTSQTIGGNIVPVTSFQYQDVGIRIDLEPRIHHNKEVTLKLTVEVSNLAGAVTGTQGQSQPIIGTRTIESTIRLKDGETNFLAGLIRSDDIVDDTGVPGLSDIPILGRLFASTSANRTRSDLVLTLTPHIIRTPDILEEDLLPIWVGTEANITFRGGSPRVESDAEGPFDEEGEESEDIREMIRRRIQNLPPGLRDEEEQPLEGEEGENLVEPGLPSDLFRDEDEEGEEEPPSDFFGDEDEGPEDQEEEPPFAADALPDESAAAHRATRAASSGSGREGAVFADLRPAMAGGAVLRLTPERLAVAVGESFEVAVRVESATAVSHVPAAVVFDPQRLSVERVRRGDFLGPTGAAEVLSDLSEPGRVLLGASRLGRGAGVTGGGPVAWITLRGLRAGPASLEIVAARALDAARSPIAPLAVRGATVEVLPPGPRRGPLDRHQRPWNG